jgi:hypothetical protein
MPIREKCVYRETHKCQATQNEFFLHRHWSSRGYHKKPCGGPVFVPDPQHRLDGSLLPHINGACARSVALHQGPLCNLIAAAWPYNARSTEVAGLSASDFSWETPSAAVCQEPIFDHIDETVAILWNGYSGSDSR